MPQIEMENGAGDVPAIGVERTLALIKPDAIHKSEEIEEIILESGFTILQVFKKAYFFRNRVCI